MVLLAVVPRAGWAALLMEVLRGCCGRCTEQWLSNPKSSNKQGEQVARHAAFTASTGLPVGLTGPEGVWEGAERQNLGTQRNRENTMAHTMPHTSAFSEATPVGQAARTSGHPFVDV